MIIKIEGLCSYEGCLEPATRIAEGCDEGWGERIQKGHPLAVYCEAHANIVSREDGPEYVTECPNCKCYFGVN